MNRSPLLALAAAAVLMGGCGSSDADAETGAITGGDPPNPDSLVYDSTEFTLQPGDELIQCEYVPADGRDRNIKGFTSNMTVGSHHLVVFRIDETKGAPEMGLHSCTQLELPPGFDGLFPGAQEPVARFSLPEGVVMQLEPKHGLYFQMHYINTTTEPMSAKVHWTAEATDAVSGQQTAGMLFYSNYGLHIPPLAKSTASQTCKAPADITLLTATGHMHKHGLTFDATAGEEALYHTDTWNEPEGAVFASPGYEIKAGTPITWSCAFNNDTPDSLVFGNSAATNEMCILAALFYPSEGSGTDFGCIH